MTNLSPQTIEELRKIICEDYGKDISFAEASGYANGLVGYFDLLAKLHHRIKVPEVLPEQK